MSQVTFRRVTFEKSTHKVSEMSPFAYKYLVFTMLHNLKVLGYFMVEPQYRQDFPSPNKTFFYKMTVIL